MSKEKKNKASKQKNKDQSRFNLVESTIKEASVPKIAHEFRTRLSIMRGALENVLDGIFGPLGGEQDKQLRLANDSVERMSELVEDLMESFSDRAGTFRVNILDAPLQPIVSHAVEGMRSVAFKEGIAVVAEIPDAPLIARCDPSKIEQVLINLLRNAIKFTSRGGTVTVKAWNEGKTVMVSVTDTGVGIPSDKLKKICSVPGDIKELKDAGGDFRISGLGLIIVREIIDAHKGEIKVVSEIGKGTTFTFTLQKS
ncbi:sensor histidine kinase [bacterium]